MPDNTYILGPCAIENEEMYLSSAKYLHKVMRGRDWYFKASFDKANRTSIRGSRGIGHNLGYARQLMYKVKSELPDIKLTTDIHEPWQAPYFKDVIDLIQVPAFLCRQTDLIISCAIHYNKVNIKKMQHLGPNNLIKSIDKLRDTNPRAEVWLTDRGTNLGYDHLVVDFAMVDKYKDTYDKVFLDATHSTQRSRASHGVQGDRDLAERYFLAAPLFNYSGIFAEVHPDPPQAVSDEDCQIYMYRVPKLVEELDDR